MINFFRKIRQKLLSENKFSKYLIYAIGEIILVVIGILIALSINNWNEERKDGISEREALDELKQDLMKSLEDIEQNIRYDKDRLESAWKIKNHIETSSEFADSLGYDLVQMTRDEYLIPVSKTYMAIKSAGFKIIKNDSIRDYTDRIYELMFPRLVRSTSHEPDIQEFFADYAKKNFKVISTDTLYKSNTEIDSINTRTMWYLGNGNRSKYIPIDYNHFRTDPEFIVIYDMTTRWRMKKLMHYELTRRAVRGLIKMMEENSNHN